MQRWKFSRDFKLEAVRLIGGRGVTVTQVARHLEVYKNVLRKLVQEQEAAPDRRFRTRRDEAGTAGG